ncbi:unnamed protein product [Boreogadus saida]
MHSGSPLRIAQTKTKASPTPAVLVHFLMILSANWAYLKDASHMHAYQDIKLKEEQELLDITTRSKECLNTYT